MIWRLQGAAGNTAAAQTIFAARRVGSRRDAYPFNLGLLALQTNDPASAATYFRGSREREPDNSEDRALLILSLEKAGNKTEAEQERESANETFGPNGLPAIRSTRRTKPWRG